MRNKNSFSLRAMMALFVMVAGISLALDRQPAAQQTQSQQTPAPQAPEQRSQPQSPAQEQDKEKQDGQGGEQPPRTPAGSGKEEAQAPERFVPSQRTSADNNATFPVDI